MLKKFEEEAANAEKEFAAQFEAPVEETKEPTTAPEPTAEVKPDAAAESTTEPVQPPEENEWEKKYKDSLKGMNEAQRKAAEAAKLAEDADKRAKELEARLNESLEAARKFNEAAKAKPPVVEDDDLEQDLPEVAKIAKRNADRVRDELKRELDEMKAWRASQEERFKVAEQETVARRIYDEVKTAYPDYDSIVNSEEMIAWVNNEAPPVFKAIFDGAIPATAKDRILVLDAFKQTTTPTKKVVVASTPGAAEVAAPVKTNTPITTKQKTEAPITEAELEHFMHNSHKMSSEELAEWDRRLTATT